MEQERKVRRKEGKKKGNKDKKRKGGIEEEEGMTKGRVKEGKNDGGENRWVEEVGRKEG